LLKCDGVDGSAFQNRVGVSSRKPSIRATALPKLRMAPTIFEEVEKSSFEKSPNDADLSKGYKYGRAVPKLWQKEKEHEQY
jgi:hypothetical protein